MNRKARIGLAAVVLLAMAAAILFLRRQLSQSGSSIPNLVSGIKTAFTKTINFSVGLLNVAGMPDSSVPVTLKVKAFPGIIENPAFRTMGQATLLPGETKYAFRKPFILTLAPPVGGLLAVALHRRTDRNEIEGTLSFDFLPVWKGVLWRDGKAVGGLNLSVPWETLGMPNEINGVKLPELAVFRVVSWV